MVLLSPTLPITGGCYNTSSSTNYGETLSKIEKKEIEQSVWGPSRRLRKENLGLLGCYDRIAQR